MNPNNIVIIIIAIEYVYGTFVGGPKTSLTLSTSRCGFPPHIHTQPTKPTIIFESAVQSITNWISPLLCTRYIRSAIHHTTTIIHRTHIVAAGQDASPGVRGVWAIDVAGPLSWLNSQLYSIGTSIQEESGVEVSTGRERICSHFDCCDESGLSLMGWFIDRYYFSVVNVTLYLYMHTHDVNDNKKGLFLFNTIKRGIDLPRLGLHFLNVLLFFDYFWYIYDCSCEWKQFLNDLNKQ